MSHPGTELCRVTSVTDRIRTARRRTASLCSCSARLTNRGSASSISSRTCSSRGSRGGATSGSERGHEDSPISPRCHPASATTARSTGVLDSPDSPPPSATRVGRLCRLCRYGGPSLAHPARRCSEPPRSDVLDEPGTCFDFPAFRRELPGRRRIGLASPGWPSSLTARVNGRGVRGSLGAAQSPRPAALHGPRRNALSLPRSLAWSWHRRATGRQLMSTGWPMSGTWLRRSFDRSVEPSTERWRTRSSPLAPSTRGSAGERP